MLNSIEPKVLFTEILGFGRRELSVYSLIYQHLSSGLQFLLLWLIWIYILGGYAALLYVYGAAIPFSWQLLLALIPIMVWGLALSIVIPKVVKKEHKINEKTWKKFGLAILRQKKLDEYLEEQRLNQAATVDCISNMIIRQYSVPRYRLKSPHYFVTLVISIVAASTVAIIFKEHSDTIWPIVWAFVVILAIFGLALLSEWAVLHNLHDRSTSSQRILIEALSNCCLLYISREELSTQVSRGNKRGFLQIFCKGK